MELRRYLEILWRRKWVIVVTATAALVVTVIGSVMATPTYTASVTLRVSTPSEGSVSWVRYDVSYADRLMKTYAEIATSGPVLAEVQDRLGLNRVPQVKAEAVPGTELMEIAVEDVNPNVARQAASALADIVIARVKEQDARQGETAADVLGEQLAQIEEELRRARQEYEDLVARSPDASDHITALGASIAAREETRARLLDQYEQARVREAMTVHTLSVVEPAVTPEAPSRPRPALNAALGSFAGLGGGMLLAFLFENLAQTAGAADLAGEPAVELANGEPAASSLARSFKMMDHRMILVFDMGTRALDVSILDVGEGVAEERAASGDDSLGIEAWDRRILEYAADQFERVEGIDLREDRQALQRLEKAAREARTALSSAAAKEISLPFITADISGPKHLNVELTRSKLKQLTDDLVERCRGPVEEALKTAGLTAADLDHVVLVGAPTSVPMIQRIVRGLTGGREPQWFDVTPLSLGVETQGGVMTPIIERNTPVPVRRTETFSIAEDDQTAVSFHVLQGERPMAADNLSLARLVLDGLPAAPRDARQIEVTFEVEATGLLSVSAKDQATGKQRSVTTAAILDLTERDVERMIKEARRHEAEDRRRRDLVEARNQADASVYWMERKLRELGGKVPASDRDRIEDIVRDLRQARAGDDAARIRELIDALGRAGRSIDGASAASTHSGRPTTRLGSGWLPRTWDDGEPHMAGGRSQRDIQSPRSVGSARE